LSDFLGIPDGAYTDQKGGGHDKSLDAGPVFFRMVSYLGAFPFQKTLAPSVLTFEAMVKVVVLLTERYDKILKRGRKDRIKLLFGSLADVGRRDVKDTTEQPETSAQEEDSPEAPHSHAPGFSIDEPSNDDYDENDEDDDDLALAALESLDAIEVFRHDYRVDRAVYEARISVDTFHRLLMLLLAIAPLKSLESVTQYTSNLSTEKQAEVRREVDSIISGFTSDDVKNGISYKQFAKTISLALPHLFDPLTPLFEHLLFSKNLDLSRRKRLEQITIAAVPDEPPQDSAEVPAAPVMLPGSFESAILNPSMISHLSFFLPASSDRNLYWSDIHLHPVFSTVAHGESMTSFSHNVLTWQAPSLLLVQGATSDSSGSDENLITFGAYIPHSWKPSSSSSTPINTNDQSTLPCLFQLQPSHAVSPGNSNPTPSAQKTSVSFSPSTGIAIGCEVATPHKTNFGPGVPSISSSTSSSHKSQNPIPTGAGSLIIDPNLETAQLHVSYVAGGASSGGTFAPAVPPVLPPITHIDIYNLEVWGIVEPDPNISSDDSGPYHKDAISQQRAAWQFDAREAERRKGVNVKISGGSESDYQNARALLEMAGIIGDHAQPRSGGSV
jgi:hypothetical protein